MSEEEKPVSKSKEAWNDAGDKLSRLGERFKSHYKSGDGDRPSGEAVKEAFDAVSDSLEGFFSSLGSAIKDEDVQAEAKSAAAAVVDALGVTVEDLGVELKNLFKRDFDAESPPEASDTTGAESENMTDQASEGLREDLKS